MLNQLGFYVFLPALAFSKLAQSISWHDLAVWWPLPLNVLLKCACTAARCRCVYEATHVCSMCICV